MPEPRLLLVVEGQPANNYAQLHWALERIKARRILRCAWVIEDRTLDEVKRLMLTYFPCIDRFLICELGPWVERQLREPIERAE